jgi:tetratricopeptide (TPR) repeat protein
MAKNERSRRRRQEKKRKREKRLTLQRNVRRNEPLPREYVPGLDAPFADERKERRMGLLAASRGLTTEAELTQLYDEVEAQPWWDVAADLVEAQPGEVAQELAFCAMETEDLEQALEFAEEALELDASNCDALVMLARLEEKELGEEGFLARLYEAVELGAKALGGDEFFRQAEGKFGVLVFTLPYLRARFALANELRVQRRDEEALVELGDLLKLDEQDLHGARFGLTGLRLLRGDLEEARELIERFSAEERVFWRWAHVAERFRSGDEAGATAALEAALPLNPFVEPLLTSSAQPPFADDEELGDAFVEGAQIMDALGVLRPENDAFIAWLRSKHRPA